MTQRSMRLYGEAAGSAVSIQIDFGGAWAFQSVLTGADNLIARQPGQPVPPEHEIMLAEFSFPMELTGWQPMSISCSGGEMVWSRSRCNYLGPKKVAVSVIPGSIWPHGRPNDDAEILSDASQLNRDQWKAKYGSISFYHDNLEFILLSDSANTWRDANRINTVECDGRRNVMINGTPRSMDLHLREQGLMGDWAWYIGQNQTLNCEIFIADPQLD